VTIDMDEHEVPDEDGAYSISGVRFRVAATGPWEPAPQGSKRSVGKGRMVESSKYLKPWRKKVIEASAEMLREQCGGVAFDGPLAVRLSFRMHRGKSVRRPLPCVAPDLDKLERGVLDGMTQGGLIADDARVVSLTSDKLYATSDSGQGVSITVHRVIV
jgi:crossover junction endodeoxyribonuclease RusA